MKELFVRYRCVACKKVQMLTFAHMMSFIAQGAVDFYNKNLEMLIDDDRDHLSLVCAGCTSEHGLEETKRLVLQSYEEEGGS